MVAVPVLTNEEWADIERMGKPRRRGRGPATNKRSRSPLTAATKAKISEALRGNDNHVMMGRAREVGSWEPDWHLAEVGRLLRAARLERDISMRTLADATGIDEATIVRIETNSRRRARKQGPRLDTVIRLALALGVRPYEVMP